MPDVSPGWLLTSLASEQITHPRQTSVSLSVNWGDNYLSGLLCGLAWLWEPGDWQLHFRAKAFPANPPRLASLSPSSFPESRCLGTKVLPSVPAPHPAPWPGLSLAVSCRGALDLSMACSLATPCSAASGTVNSPWHLYFLPGSCRPSLRTTCCPFRRPLLQAQASAKPTPTPTGSPGGNAPLNEDRSKCHPCPGSYLLCDLD